MFVNENTPGLNIDIQTDGTRTITTVFWDGSMAKDGGLPRPIWWGSDELGTLSPEETEARAVLKPVLAAAFAPDPVKIAPAPQSFLRRLVAAARVLFPGNPSARDAAQRTALSNGGRATPETVANLMGR